LPATDFHLALAAIQGLNQKLEEKMAAQEAAMRLKETRISSLEKKLVVLEDQLMKLSSKGPQNDQRFSRQVSKYSQ